MSTGASLVSTHIKGLGHALFQIHENQLKLRKRSSEDVSVDRSWITSTGLVVEGIAHQPYLHLDIRTPFGESVNESQVAKSLAESLGPSKEKYKVGGWHIQFVEDTNLGSNHRVFVDLLEIQSKPSPLEYKDAGLPLELAIESLGEMVMAEKGDASFQFMYGSANMCFSLLFLNGSPFHVLRVSMGPSPEVALRIKQHREFVLSLGKMTSSGLSTFLVAKDPLLEFEPIRDLKPDSVILGLPQETTMDSGVSLLHLGLASAARQRDFSSHNRVSQKSRSQNYNLRTQHGFLISLALTAGFCLIVTLAFLGANHFGKRQLQKLRTSALAYQGQVDSIKILRTEKMNIELGLKELRPVWSKPLAWSEIFTDLSSALPAQSGMDGLSVVKNAEGQTEMSFRAWVRDWDQVQLIQKKLSSTYPFSSVNLSEQRKDLASGVVIFHVTCILERN